MTRDLSNSLGPRGRRTRHGVCVVAGWLILVGLGGTGCAHFPPWRKSKPTAPVIVPEDPATNGSADPVRKGGNPTAPGPLVKAKESTIPAKPRLTPPTAVTPPPMPASQPSDSTRTREILSEDIPPDERAALVRATMRDLDETTALLRTLDAAQLAGKGGEQLRTIQALVNASHEAGDRSEFREAASLAHKAWLLAMELSER